jgi:hypothetical protein
LLKYPVAYKERISALTRLEFGWWKFEKRINVRNELKFQRASDGRRTERRLSPVCQSISSLERVYLPSYLTPIRLVESLRAYPNLLQIWKYINFNVPAVGRKASGQGGLFIRVYYGQEDCIATLTYVNLGWWKVG